MRKKTFNNNIFILADSKTLGTLSFIDLLRSNYLIYFIKKVSSINNGITIIIDETREKEMINYLNNNINDTNNITIQSDYDFNNQKNTQFILKANRLYKFWLIKIFYLLGFNVNKSAEIIIFQSNNDFQKGALFCERDETLFFARFFHMPIAKGFANLLKKTFVKPNHITLFNLFLCPILFALIIKSTYITDLASILLIQIIRTLDLLDGYLARLQNTSSKYGHILDTIVDEVFSLAVFTGLIFNILNGYGYIYSVIAGLTLIIFFSNSLLYWIRNSMIKDIKKDIDWFSSKVEKKYFRERIIHGFIYSIRDIEFKFMFISLGLLTKTIVPIIIYYFIGNLIIFIKNINSKNYETA